MRGLITSSEWLTEAADVPGVVAPPVLYGQPPEGWHRWAAALTGLAPTKPGTHSGNIVAAHAPAWAQWMELKRTLSGEVPDDHGLRESFETGEPLALTPPDGIERFAYFVPVLQYLGPGRYRVGADSRDFETAGHVAALDVAARWLTECRTEEIERQREAAHRMTEQLPLIYRDAVSQQLAYDGILLTRHGDLLAMLNGPHGFYIVTSATWAYSLERVSVGVAARLAIMASLQDETPILLNVDRMPAHLGLAGWQEAENGYRWDDGVVSQAKPGFWRVVCDDKPLCIVERRDARVALIGGSRRVLLGSEVPVSLRDDVSAVLSWATWRALRRAQGT